jgi:lactoylglutathione lyase
VKTVAPFELGIVAQDIDALLPFYTELLGLSLIGDVTVPASTSRRSGLAPDGYRVVRLETDRGDRLRRGPAYVTFLVEDLGSLHERLRSSGADIRSDGIVALRPGVRLLLVADPQGNWIELLQYDDIAAYRPSAARA